MNGRVPGAVLGFQDAAQTIDERNEARMNFQTKPRIKSTIRTVAALSAVFTMTAACKAIMKRSLPYSISDANLILPQGPRQASLAI